MHFNGIDVAGYVFSGDSWEGFREDEGDRDDNASTHFSRAWGSVAQLARFSCQKSRYCSASWSSSSEEEGDVLSRTITHHIAVGPINCGLNDRPKITQSELDEILSCDIEYREAFLDSWV